MGDLYPHTDPSHARDFPLSSGLRFSHSSERPPTMLQSGKNRAHMRIDFNRDHLSYPEVASSSSSLGLVASTDGRDEPSSSLPPLPGGSPNAEQPPGQPRRSRKDKMHIELSADQPPTTQGRPRTRVFVACIQCRGRKIRCDGAKPMCHHCCQRGGNEQCTYDSLPKRRGPDRVQGARTRGTRPREGEGEPPKRRRRRPATVDRDTTPPQGATSSYGIKRPLVTASPSALDILGDPVPDVSQQNAGAPDHSLEVDVFRSLGSGVRLSLTSSHDQTVTPGSTRNRNPPYGTRDIGYNSEVPNSGTIVPFGAVTDTYVVTAEGQPGNEQESNDITPDPSVEFSRKTWWDHLLRLYAVSMPASYRSLPLGQLQRDASVSQIIEDVRFVFKSSSHWFSFVNLPRFYNTFMDPARRDRMQPSLLLSLLAVSTLLQSSERACPGESRRKAMMLRDEAQGQLEASLYARAIDGELAQAAWVLSFFEVCAHPQNQATRTQSSLDILDSIIRALTMTNLDSDSPAASRFASSGMPVVDARPVGYFPTTEHNRNSVPTSFMQQPHMAVDLTIHTSRCSCDELSLGRHWPEVQRQVPLWVATPTWNREWSEGEIKKEECRRLCWSALMLISSHTSYAAAANWRHSDFFVMDPSNYSILFPGESLLPLHSQAHLDSRGGKDTVWALYLRAMLLWNACVRMRHDATASDHDRTEFAMRTWMETEAIEKALQQHTCGIERAFMFHGREFLFNTRMCISYEFQRFVPHVLIGLNRKKSEEWLRAQGQRAKTVMLGMHAVTGNIKHNLAQRPSFVWWFMGQTFRALTLWEHDNSLTIALDVCKAFLEPIQFLTSIYPGPTQQFRFDDLRERLRIACLTAEATRGYNPNPVEML